VALVQLDGLGGVAPGRTLQWLRATMWLAVAVPLLLFALVGRNLHERALAEARLRVDSAARIAEEHALKVFETNVSLLNRVADALADDPETLLRARDRSLHDQLVRMTADLRQLQGLFVIGPSGQIIVTNRVFPAPPVNVSDRAFFRHHREGGAQPYFTEVLTSRTTGEPFFDMSVRRNGADGSLTAVLSASLAPQYFADFYRQVAGQDKDMSIALRHANGALLAGWPRAPASADAASAPAGPASTVAVAEGAQRIAAERQLGSYPVFVNAWIDRSAALAPWYGQMVVLAAFVFPIALALMYVAWVALQRTHRSLRMQQELLDETAQRMEVEENLRQARKLEALGRLGGGVAHDFNNLLMVISNNLYLHRRLQPSVAGSTHLAAIERAVVGGTKLTGQLLSFSHRQALRIERVRLQELLPNTAALIEPAVGSPVRVEVQVEPDTAPIEVDVPELELALLNLAINARDAMPKGGALRIAAANRADGELPSLVGAFVVISVQDSGTGVAPELLERVFEPFFTTKPVGQGTGLGLSQVYGFCTRAGGTATFDNGLGVGATVRLYLPAADETTKPPDLAPALAPVSAAAPSPAAVSLPGVRVLLVEDNADLASASTGLLESMGCRVWHADNANLAMEVLQTQAAQFDIVLSDIVMCGTLDGMELAARIKTEHPQLPVVLISGYSESIERATALGVQVLSKPCTPQALAAAMGQAMAHTKTAQA
jgi:signal transduction histidine kinase/CheY-like chemotaxis protein